MTSRKSLAIRGVLFDWIGRGSSIAIAIFLTPFLVHTLQNERYGLWSILMSLTSYYALADLGLRSAATKYIAQYHAEGNFASVNKVANTSLVCYSVLSLVVLAVAGVLGLFFTDLVETDAVSATDAQWLVFLTAATVAMRLTVQVYQGAIVAMQQHGVRNAIAVVAQIATAIAVVIVLQMGFGLIAMAVVTLAVASAAKVVTIYVAHRLLPELRISRPYWDRETFNLVFKFGGVSSMAAIARRLSEQFAVVLIGVMFGPALVTFYDIPDRILKKVGTLSRSLNNTFFPAVSVLDAQGDHESIRKALVDLQRFCLTISLAFASVFIFMGQDIIRLWIGPEYIEKSYPLMLTLSVAFVCRMFAGPIRTFQRGAARLRSISILAGVESVLTVGLGISFALLWGLWGIALSVAVTQVISCMICLPWVAAKELDFKLSRFWAEMLLPVIPASILPTLSAYLLSIWVTPTRLLHLIPLGGVVMLFATVGVYFFCFDRKRRRDIVRAFTRTKKEKPQTPVGPEATAPYTSAGSP